MAGDPSNLLPYRWQPGQSGNPGGSSERRRVSRRLRRALDVILADGVPDWLTGQLPPEISESIPAGVTFAELIALRLVWAASTSSKPATVLQAAQLIIAAQAKPDALEQREPKRPPKLEATDDRRRAVAEQLGVDLEPPPAADLNVH